MEQVSLLQTALLAKKRFCSNCDVSHSVDGKTPCVACYRLKCPRCGTRSSVANPFVCRNCRHKMKLSRKLRNVVVHNRGMMNCPRCGRKLRNGARDKRRSMGLKT